jgi:hypothetical protein
MGYTIIIGELKVEKHKDDGTDSDCLSFTAEVVRLEKAPAFGEPTDHTNTRWPSYTAWSNAMRGLGLYDLFYNENGHLIGGQSGVRLVTEDLFDEFKTRLRLFEISNPNVTATYGNTENCLLYPDKNNPEVNAWYVRGVWLEFWMEWALKNCETPVIAVS